MGSVEGLVVSLENIQVRMDFLSIDNPTIGLIIGLPTLELLHASIDLEK